MRAGTSELQCPPKFSAVSPLPQQALLSQWRAGRETSACAPSCTVVVGHFRSGDSRGTPERNSRYQGGELQRLGPETYVSSWYVGKHAQGFYRKLQVRPTAPPAAHLASFLNRSALRTRSRLTAVATSPSSQKEAVVVSERGRRQETTGKEMRADMISEPLTASKFRGISLVRPTRYRRFTRHDIST